MLIAQYKFIETWTEDDLLTLPSTETSEYEYKSSAVKDTELPPKIAKAASAFWNSGGGILVIGVDNNGKIDGGISENVGRESRLDWIHRQISKVSPHGKYFVKLIPAKNSNSHIHPNHVVTVIAFEESPLAPHMATDNKYYIRLGTHSDPATHFLVEAIRAKKYLQTPIVRALLSNSDKKASFVDLVVIVINEATALNIELTFDPFPTMIEKHIKEYFPLHIPVIDKQHPFTMEFFRIISQPAIFGTEPVLLKLKYEDVLGNSHQYEQLIDPNHNRLPMEIGNETLADIEKGIEQIAVHIKQFNKIANAFYQRTFPPSDNAPSSID